MDSSLQSYGNDPLDDLDQWEDDVLQRYPEPLAEQAKNRDSPIQTKKSRRFVTTKKISESPKWSFTASIMWGRPLTS